MDLLERDDELTIMRAALSEAVAGSGRLIVVEGVAGSGKSSLLAALRQPAAPAGLRVLAARGGELERGFAFGTIRQLFEKPLASADHAQRERFLGGAAAPAASVVSSDPAGSAVSGFAVLHAFYWLANNLAVDTPLLLAVDDLHWVDRPSLLALSYLGRRIADLPIALVVALRPDEPGGAIDVIDGLRREPDAVTVALRPLGREVRVHDRARGDPGGGRCAVRGLLRGHGRQPVLSRSSPW